MLRAIDSIMPGRRHGSFVIARIRPTPDFAPRYCCVAALRDQCFYGRMPLLAIRRFMTLLSQPDNAKIVSAELGDAEHTFLKHHIPFPFLSFLHASSWAVDFETTDPGVGVVSYLYSRITCDGPDNYDGITIVDATDPLHPAYCFSRFSSPPINAEQFVRFYLPKPEEDDKGDVDIEANVGRKEKRRLKEEHVLQAIAALDGESMVTMKVLSETWPFHFPDAQVDEVESENGRGKDMKGVAGGVGRSKDGDSGVVIPPLATLTLHVAIPHALQNGDTVGLEDMVWMPDKALAMKSFLRTLSDFPEPAICLLRKIVAAEHDSKTRSVDLSLFPLSSEELARVLRGLPEGLDTLDLSSNQALTADGLREVFAEVPYIRRLVLLYCPLITNASLYQLVSSCPSLFLGTESIVHPAFMVPRNLPDGLPRNMLGGDKSLPYTPAFTFIGFEQQDFEWNNCAVSLPFFTPSLVVRGLTSLLGALVKAESHSDILRAEFASQAAFTATYPVGASTSWDKRILSMVPHAHRSWRAIAQQEGWTFCLHFMSKQMQFFVTELRDFNAMISPTGYAFVKFSKLSEADARRFEGEQGPEEDWNGRNKASAFVDALFDPAPETLGLRPFIDRMVAEGHPAPLEEDVVKLEDTLRTMESQSMTPLFKGNRLKRTMLGVVDKMLPTSPREIVGHSLRSRSR